MSNMSYCRFENTLNDLQDCDAAMDEGEELEGREAKAKEQLVELCKEIVEKNA